MASTCRASNFPRRNFPTFGQIKLFVHAHVLRPPYSSNHHQHCRSVPGHASLPGRALPVDCNRSEGPSKVECSRQLSNHHSPTEMNDSAFGQPWLFTFDLSRFRPYLIVIVVEDSLST